jgi:NADH-quinone oxidoreductase subunit J
VLLIQFIVTLSTTGAVPSGGAIAPQTVGINMFTVYLIGVELASILLLAGLVAAFHFGLLPDRLEDADEQYTD